MIFNICTPAPRKKSITVYGGILETVTLTGTNGEGTYSVTTKVGGKSDPITVPIGTYNVTSNLSGTTNYSKQVNVNKATSVITSYPDSAIFWLGNGDSTNDTLYSKCGGFDAIQNISGYYYPYDTSRGYSSAMGVTSNTSDSSWAAYYTFSGTGWGEWFNNNTVMKNSIDTTGYSTIKVVVRTEHSNSAYTDSYTCGFTSTDITPDYGIYYYVTSSAWCPTVGNTGIISLAADKYLSFSTSMYLHSGIATNYNFQIWAIWLE